MVAPGYQVPSGMAEQRVEKGSNFKREESQASPFAAMGVREAAVGVGFYRKEVHSPTRVDDKDDNPEDDSPIFMLKVSVSLDVMGRCMQLN